MISHTKLQTNIIEAKNNKVNKEFKAEILDRFSDAMLGLAVGDAMGIPLEFTIPGSFEPVNDMIGGGPFDLDRGMWTDDTSIPLLAKKQ